MEIFLYFDIDLFCSLLTFQMMKTSLKYNDDLMARFDVVTTIYAVHTQWLGVALSLTDIDESGSYM